ncbi:cation:proton antiporter [Uliginosibacterium flavum]|uniref:Cation:proton antiporter n=1 Tax=Uliginosibacterium flavum TaxID=1396831 RepID=A0ABV2TN16_9RHOO
MDSLLDLQFWPDWPLALDPLACFGLVLFLAVVLGEIASRLRLPRISAYVATGVVLSFGRELPLLAGLLPSAHLVFELAFALLLFELGQRIDLGWLRRNPWLLATSLAESLLAFVAVGALMLLFDQPPILALLIAALTASTGPAVVLGVSKDSAARGQVTDRLALLSALGSCYSFVVLGVAYAWQHGETTEPLAAVLHPLYLLLGSMLLGGMAAWAVLRILARIKPGDNSQTLAAIALIIIAVALAKTLDLSVVISLLFAGILSRSLDRQHRLQPMDFGLISRLALIVVFVATGALLQPAQFMAALPAAVGLLAARALAKGVGVFLFARPSGLSLRKASLLSIGLLPMSGAALLWVESTAAIWPELGAQLAAIVLTALLIMEFLAPPALQFALRRANETGDKP